MRAKQLFAGAALSVAAMSAVSCGEGVLLGGNHGSNSSGGPITLPLITGNISNTGSGTFPAMGAPPYSYIGGIDPAITPVCLNPANDSGTPCILDATAANSTYSLLNLYFDATGIDLSLYQTVRLAGKIVGGVSSAACAAAFTGHGTNVGIWKSPGGGSNILPAGYPDVTATPPPINFQTVGGDTPANLVVPFSGFPAGNTQGFVVRVLSTVSGSSSGSFCSRLALYWVQLTLEP